MANLVISTVVDPRGSRRWRSCGKLWVASLLRHQWDGMILIQRNFPEPLFPVERVDLKESQFVPVVTEPLMKTVKWHDESRNQQLLRADEMACKVERFDWVLLADADCVALRNPDHLLAGEGDLLVSRSGGMPDPGFVAVRGKRLRALVSALKEHGGLNAPALEKVARTGEWKVRDFERGEVLRPWDPDVALADLAQAAVIHFSGMKPEDKQRLAFAFHMMAVYGDPDGLFFDMMEA